MPAPRTEVHTTVCCAHPYFGYVNTPNAVIDFSDRVPEDFNHRAVATIDANGFRNPGAPDTKPANEYWIGVFGGSVAFGVPASTDAHTVPGCLERRLVGSRGDQRRVRVYNFAIPGGQQPQQLLMAAVNRDRLDAVITFDGVNEVVVPSCYNRDRVPPDFPYLPYYSALYGGAVSDDQAFEAVSLKRRQMAFAARPGFIQRLLGRQHARDVADRRRRLEQLQDTGLFQSQFSPGTGTAEERAVTGADSWARHTATTAMLCRAAGIASLHVVQPIPDTAKPLTSAEDARVRSQLAVVQLRAAGYARVLAHARRMKLDGLAVEEFSEVFSECREAIYTDLVHFEDRGSELVAERLAAHITGSWDGFRR